MRDQAGALSGTAPGLRRNADARLAGLEAANPDWQPLLRAVREVIAALRQPALLASVELAPHPPLLDGATIVLHHDAGGRFLNRLAIASGTSELLLSSRPPVLPYLIRAIQELGESPNPPSRSTALARLAVIPLLTECASRAPAISPWPLGHCPVCASWPIVAESRGLERARRLRCPRCAADWAGELLCCGYCGERDHTRLGALVSEGTGATAAADTCLSCGGYLKTVTTLTPLAPEDLLLLDFETVELDLAAQREGFARPGGLGVPLTVTLTEAFGPSSPS